MKALLAPLAAMLVGTSLHTLSLSAPVVVGGRSLTATLRLAQDAASGPSVYRVVVTDTSVASAPATVAVPAGSTIVTFTVLTHGVAARKLVKIAVADTSATLTVDPASLVQLTLTPTSVARGRLVKGTVALDGHAPASGAGVRLVVVSSAGVVNPPGIRIPPSVTIPGDKPDESFSITVDPTASSGQYTIIATLGQVALRQNLQVQ